MIYINTQHWELVTQTFSSMSISTTLPWMPASLQTQVNSWNFLFRYTWVYNSTHLNAKLTNFESTVCGYTMFMLNASWQDQVYTHLIQWWYIYSLKISHRESGIIDTMQGDSCQSHCQTLHGAEWVQSHYWSGLQSMDKLFQLCSFILYRLILRSTNLPCRWKCEEGK